MADMFDFTVGDLLNLRKFYKRAPRAFGRAAVGMLNNVAFGARKDLLETIDRQMNIRNRGFVNSRMRVKKATGDDISTAFSQVGSVVSTRFTGWVEQETGQKDKRNRIYSQFSRGGAEEKKVRPSRTRRSSNRILRMSDMGINNAKNDQHRVIIYLQMIDQMKRGQMFFLRKKHKRLQKGVYAMSGRRRSKKQRQGGASGSGKINRVSADGSMRTKKRPWMKPTIDKTVTTATMRKAWGQSIKHQLDRIK